MGNNSTNLMCTTLNMLMMLVWCRLWTADNFKIYKGHNESDTSSSEEMGNRSSFNPKTKFKETPHILKYVTWAKGWPPILVQSTTAGMGKNSGDGLSGHAWSIDHCPVNINLNWQCDSYLFFSFFLLLFTPALGGPRLQGGCKGLGCLPSLRSPWPEGASLCDLKPVYR